MMQPETFEGACHCGAVRFSVTTALDNLGDCNCSRCRRLGWVMQAVPATAFTLQSGADALETYRFNTHRIEHLFCRACGIESFARGKDANGNDTVVVNVNCLENVPEFDRASIRHWDGKSW